MLAATPRWDIFCTAVDNYGDVGVAWRLARQLAREHGVAARLYVDRLAVLSGLAPEVDATLSAQTVAGVEVRRRDAPDAQSGEAPGDVVIEAFGCGLPQAYLAAMVARERPPVWINLEYLSAEAWIEGCHGLASRHPSLPLTRYFFFPGFTRASAGLLREADLFARRDRFRADARARAAWWRGLGLAAPAREATVASLFCYSNAALPALLDTWAAGAQPLCCVVPEGIASEAVLRWAGSGPTRPATPLVRGRLSLALLPFLSQDDYDRLLWACDVNFVRGEDSFVRAQWAARPLIWHVYPQTGAAHRLKLAAFASRYGSALPGQAAAAWRGLGLAWNGEGDIAPAWAAFAAARAALHAHAERWASELARQRDLASALVKFCADRV